ncbi:MAG TPA: Smr/MutS family protein [Thermoanaerobaculia bacterium]|jgi:DNA-nicking Smr family endonuclease|nr:Smr/MutS family protein [Thermoanaerobaculia bacterium]
MGSKGDDQDDLEDGGGEPAGEIDGLGPIEIPITDVLDVHSFRPAEVADVVREYLDTAYAKGLRSLRIIHGRGIGVQRRSVRTLLERDPRVIEFGDAPPEAGGWGATWVRLR